MCQLLPAYVGKLEHCSSVSKFTGDSSSRTPELPAVIAHKGLATFLIQLRPHRQYYTALPMACFVILSPELLHLYKTDETRVKLNGRVWNECSCEA